MGSLPMYSPCREAELIFAFLCEQSDALGLPASLADIKKNVIFESAFDRVYFPIPLKETETASALKALEGSVACALADLRTGCRRREIRVNLEKATLFLFQAYLSTVDGLGKQDEGVRAKLKDTDLLRAQSDPYRRMSANLYSAKDPGRYYHIHGSLEASTTLKMIGLAPYRPDLKTHEAIVGVIEPAVQKFSVQELERLNLANRQAGTEALKYTDFIKTPHGLANVDRPSWTVTCIESQTPPVPLPHSSIDNPRVLEGIKVLELCRIIAGPTITRILGEYGADVIKITGPHLSDVPFFQVDGNMGKHATELDLKSPEGRRLFELLLADVDIVVDGYRPGALDRLGYGAAAIAEIGANRGKGIVYVNENCFGYEGEWANRPGWQQIADCASGVAWAQGEFMGLNEPIVPPFPISDYGTGCMGAIAALSGLYHRSTRGGSWHGKVSLLQYDLLLFKMGPYPSTFQTHQRQNLTPEFLALRHSHSVDQISKTTLVMMRQQFPELFTEGEWTETWYSEKYNADVCVVKPVVSLDGIQIGFRRGSRPNGADGPSWSFGEERDFRRNR